MSIKGKKAYKIYLPEEDTELVKSYLDRSKAAGGMSGLIGQYITTVANTLRESEIGAGEKLGWGKMFKLFVNGLRNSKHIN